jgi:lysophospholipase L1-like esterase
LVDETVQGGYIPSCRAIPSRSLETATGYSAASMAAPRKGAPVRIASRLLPACWAGLFAVLVVTSSSLQADDKKPDHGAVKPSERKDKGAVQRHEKFLEIAKKGDVDVLFLGDSITQGWEGAGKEAWKKNFEPLKAANFGIGGDQTQHVLWRITEGKELEGIKPKVAVLMIGTNNTGGYDAEQIADGITAIVAELRKQKPEMHVLLLGVFPRSEQPDTAVRQKINGVNERIAKLDDGKKVHYLDIGKKFLQEDGTLTKEIMPDLLHLSAKGYDIWAEAIKEPVEKMLK